jgi:hypothetical protein
MAKLREETVQHAAIDWLVNQLASRPEIVAVECKPEATIASQSPLGNGRADGLIAGQRTDGSIYVISMEAKSWRTEASLLGQPNDVKWNLHGLPAGCAVFLLAAGLGRLSDAWVWMWLAPGILAVGATGAFLFYTRNHPRYATTGVVDQAKRYPANESWVAISAHVWGRLYKDEQAALEARCREAMVGLLVVSSKQKVRALLSPGVEETPKGLRDYLVCYSAGENMRRVLAEKAASLTPGFFGSNNENPKP